MKQNEFHELVIRELSAIKDDIKQVRQADIPVIREGFAKFKGTVEEQIKVLKDRTSWSSRLYTVLGGALAVAVAKFTGSTN